jgi:ABC-type Na+ efflux pump permease subunit
MNWRGIWTVVSKDLRVVRRSKMIMMPMIILPVLLQVIIPAGIGLMAYFAADAMAADIDEFMTMLSIMPQALQDMLAGLDPSIMFLELMLVYAFAPLYLVTPMMVASVIAADSFVGERERKTLEALLHTPLTDRELLVAKMLGAWLAAVAVTILSFLLYGIVLTVIGVFVVGRIFFPNAMWIALVFWVAPAVAGMGLGVTVLLSTRVKTFQEAYQFGGVLVVPIILLMVGQLAGVIYLSVWLTLGLGLVFWAVVAVMIWFGAKTFDRDALLAQL